MANVRDVARYILHRSAPMSSMKLQKLAYYAQGWHLAFDGEPLFDSKIEAWANGPVVRDLYNAHRGLFTIHENTLGQFDENSLTTAEKETVDAVLEAYGDMDAHRLSNLTHSERPWIEAREGLADGTRGEAEISQASMLEFFDALLITSPS
ncbi:Panacea domain-containing protein [Mycobacterium persicum]|uniref:Panacea domain-containing protein n=1 Tax=Mycobacterium persicum TaxID=1487726 RepID=UPI0015949D4E|nr:type II toxin-antitoxin system antitoxin SocA domain-containing protein [Mycobacterium persicum]